MKTCKFCNKHWNWHLKCFKLVSTPEGSFHTKCLKAKKSIQQMNQDNAHPHLHLAEFHEYTHKHIKK